MAEEQIEVPEYVIEALAEVRSEGKYNMFDGLSILRELYDQENYQAVNWLAVAGENDRARLNTKRYMAALNKLGKSLS